MLGISKYIIIGQFVALLLMGVAGYFYFRHAQSTIEGLSADKARLETAVAMQEDTIRAQQAAARRQNTENLALQQRLNDADRTRRDLESSFRRRNLEALARANSADFEQRINRATVQVFRDIETLTQPRDRPTTTPEASPDVPVSPTNTRAATDPSVIPANHQPPPRPPRNYQSTGGQQ